MFERIRHFGRDLLGRNDALLITEVVGQLDATADAAAVALNVAEGARTPGDGRAELDVLERRGDSHRRALIEQLARTLAPPIDREDLFRFSRSVDDVLDNLRDLGRELDLFRLPGEPLLVEPLRLVNDGIDGLSGAVKSLVDDPAAAAQLTVKANKTDIRESYQAAMASLLDGQEPVTARTLRRREVLRRIDVVGLRLTEASDVLLDGTIKRSR